MKYGRNDAPASGDTRDFSDAETGAGTMNRTGAVTSPGMALDMIRQAQRTPPDPEGDATQLAEYRKPYIEEGAILGSMPLPNDMDPDEAGESAQPLLLDKLGERLAFERQGVRLYECLIGKARIQGHMPGGPTLRDLEHILKEERDHFHFLQQAIIQAGGDPTVQTPCANVAGILSQGIVQVVADPRTTLVQCLEAMLSAELADNDGWAMLRELVEAVGEDEWLEKIEEAEANEQEHLEKVRGWLSTLVLGEVSQAVEEAMEPEEESMGEGEIPAKGEADPPESPRRGKPGAERGEKPSRSASAKKKRKS